MTAEIVSLSETARHWQTNWSWALCHTSL